MTSFREKEEARNPNRWLNITELYAQKTNARPALDACSIAVMGTFGNLAKNVEGMYLGTDAELWKKESVFFSSQLGRAVRNAIANGYADDSELTADMLEKLQQIPERLDALKTHLTGALHGKLSDDLRENATKAIKSIDQLKESIAIDKDDTIRLNLASLVGEQVGGKLAEYGVRVG